MKNLPIKPLAKKSLGQHFLHDENIIMRILTACQLTRNDIVLEIGPGRGALTHQLSSLVKKLFLIEKDRALAKELREHYSGNSCVDVMEGDFLKISINKIPKGTKIIGNLPYNVATPIIEKIIESRRQFLSFYFMVQLEHGKRMVAQPGSKDYSSLSCFIQYYTKIRQLFTIKAGAFQPPPKVQSVFLEMIFRKQPLYPCRDEKLLFQIIRTAFQQRRKTIGNSLNTIIPKDQAHHFFQKAGIDPAARAGTIDIKNFVALTNALDGGRGRRQ